MSFKVKGSVFRIAIVIVLICLSVGFFGGCEKENPADKYDIDKVFYVKEADLTDTEIIEVKYIGDEVTKTFCDTKVTAVYDKTVYKPIGDITELRYKITALERDGVAEEVSENDYIGFDTNGNIISFTPKIYPGKLKFDRTDRTYSLEMNDGAKWQTDTSYFDYESVKEIRPAIEKLLGDIVDWDIYSNLDVRLHHVMSFANLPDLYGSITFTWTQGKNVGFEERRTDDFVTCTVQFAYLDRNTGEYKFLENAYISGLHINSPFGDKKITSEYIAEYAVFDPNLMGKSLSNLLEKDGYDVDSGEKYLTVFDGRICKIFEIEATKDYITTKYYAIYPLE